MKTFKQNINESSLSRLWSHNNDHDCAALTAFRVATDCGKGGEYSHKDNQNRNKSLKAKLLSLGYGVTVLKGRYPEGGETAIEISFFVVNLNDRKDFFKIISKLGENFEQDSVLLIPKGSINNDAKAYLYGTNHCSNNWLGYHKKEVFAKGKLGRVSKIYTSYVGKRPFIFEEIGEECILPSSGMGRWMMNIIAEKDWKELED